MPTGKSHRPLSLFSMLVLLLLVWGLALLAGCGGADGEAGAPAGDVILEVVGTKGSKSYTLDDLQSMPVGKGYWGMKSSTGRITPPVVTKGVLFDDLFADVGGLPDDMAIGIVAKDGYEMTMSVEQLRTGEFITYDMVTGEEKKVAGPLTVLVAYEYDGKAFDPTSDGPLRLAIVSPEQNQVTDGHWAVKWVSKLRLKDIEQEWVLTLKGKIIEEMDRATFESGAAEGCHGRDWTDADGGRWTGIPLYLMVGRVDDEVAHEGPAYNRELAQAGYQVVLKTSSGADVEISSEAMYYKRDIILAYKLDGQPLPEEYWPLRLVGEGLDEADMVGQIIELEALVPME